MYNGFLPCLNSIAPAEWGQVGESCDLVNDRQSSLRGPPSFRCGIVESRIRGCTKGSLVVGSGRVVSSREQYPGAVKERPRYDDIPNA
jgi:hypothetical protein